MKRWPLALLVAAVAGGCGGKPEHVTAGDAAMGREVIAEAGCGVCHEIPGIAGARGRLGPSLAGLGNRRLIAGQLPNRQDVLARWIRNAPAFAPQTAMPPMPLDENAARDAAAYLARLR